MAGKKTKNLSNRKRLNKKAETSRRRHALRLKREAEFQRIRALNAAVRAQKEANAPQNDRKSGYSYVFLRHILQCMLVTVAKPQLEKLTNVILVELAKRTINTDQIRQVEAVEAEEIAKSLTDIIKKREKIENPIRSSKYKNKFENVDRPNLDTNNEEKATTSDSICEEEPPQAAVQEEMEDPGQVNINFGQPLLMEDMDAMLNTNFM